MHSNDSQHACTVSMVSVWQTKITVILLNTGYAGKITLKVLH